MTLSKLRKTVIATGFMLSFASTALGAKSFTESCIAIDGQSYGEDKIGFYCFTNQVAAYDYQYSMIDLRHCMGNSDGSLIKYDDGNYQQSCEECSLKFVRVTMGGDKQIDSAHLKCQCSDLKGQKHEAEIDLDDVLENDDGRLVCFDHKGTRKQAPPECHHNDLCRGRPRLRVDDV